MVASISPVENRCTVAYQQWLMEEAVISTVFPTWTVSSFDRSVSVWHKVGLKSVANITTNNSCKYRSEFRPRPAETFAFISSHSSRSGRLAESSVRASLLLSGLGQCRVTAVKIRTSASAPPSRQNPTLLENKGSNLFGLLRGNGSSVRSRPSPPINREIQV